ncbi:Hypothetical predicted protein [Octopus vulgaris]|uniref:Uncharacterized protein n=1 Tax=Octopus vulgaris TaxID=6645 RepID=A0AA36F727_OCTVU|nr:Hypothetical predicted protein [Octopus vulgaris]
MKQSAGKSNFVGCDNSVDSLSSMLRGFRQDIVFERIPTYPNHSRATSMIKYHRATQTIEIIDKWGFSPEGVLDNRLQVPHTDLRYFDKMLA